MTAEIPRMLVKRYFVRSDSSKYSREGIQFLKSKFLMEISFHPRSELSPERFVIRCWNFYSIEVLPRFHGFCYNATGDGTIV